MFKACCCRGLQTRPPIRLFVSLCAKKCSFVANVRAKKCSFVANVRAKKCSFVANIRAKKCSYEEKCL